MNETLTLHAHQTGDTCWRLVSDQYFYSREAALAALGQATDHCQQDEPVRKDWPVLKKEQAERAAASVKGLR